MAAAEQSGNSTVDQPATPDACRRDREQAQQQAAARGTGTYRPQGQPHTAHRR